MNTSTTVAAKGGPISIRPSGATLEDLYVAHAPEALRVAYLLTGDHYLAEDLAQEAFLRVLGRWGNLRKPEAFRAYLLRAVVNLTKNQFRRRDVERRAPTPTSESSTSIPEIHDELWAALNRLPHRQRASVVLRYCEDLSEEATAHMLNTSPRAIRSMVARGMKKLRGEVQG